MDEVSYELFCTRKYVLFDKMHSVALRLPRSEHEVFANISANVFEARDGFLFWMGPEHVCPIRQGAGRYCYQNHTYEYIENDNSAGKQ